MKAKSKNRGGGDSHMSADEVRAVQACVLEIVALARRAYGRDTQPQTEALGLSPYPAAANEGTYDA